uniref:Uncharacterized protein n=1 Tax=Heterorhabditis bacteriophora TaxID=37862 RepID=A0A1I7WCZ9_HETBA
MNVYQYDRQDDEEMDITYQYVNYFLNIFLRTVYFEYLLKHSRKGKAF